ncbi:MAG: large-conductance mechanosensitive channel protein MscL [Clostridiaceae bacterium]|nr:large-conductance mechanosensitive channel protein MscL [Clostridiaceae bacterium]
MWADFKKFIMRGNVIDLAVAVVIGAAFNAVVTSLVNDIIMPVVGALTAGINFSEFKIILTQAVLENDKIIKPEVAITYGHLIQVIIQFLIIAVTIFFIIRLLNKLQKKKEPAPAAKPADVQLLEEIRDILKSGNK